MLRRRNDDDLFRDSTMTFGEHLEELRQCLFKAVMGLLLGLIVGFFLGGYVVEFIQTPLTNALKTHVIAGAETGATKEIKQLQDAGEEFPWTQERVAAIIREIGALPEIVYVAREEISAPRSPLANPGPGPTDGAVQVEQPVSEAEKSALAAIGLKPMMVWHKMADDRRLKLIALNTHEGFMIWLKASLLVGAVLASPWIFIQLWSFVAAGLYPHEKRYVNIYLPFSIALFVLGVVVAFYGAFPLILKFLFSFNRSMGIEIEPRISEWLSFVLMLPLGFGIAFQLPLVMLFLERIGVVTAATYLSYWRVAILVIFGVAAILTPPDPWSMSLLALPLTFLYFGGILLCRWMPRGKGLFPVEE